MGNKLFTVRNEVQKRFKDVEYMTRLLKKCPEVDSQRILKAATIMMLYNIIEGTFSNILTELFDYIAEQKIITSKLPIKLQNTLSKYYSKKGGASYDCTQVCALSYLEINKYLKLFSGNLDSRSIQDISEKLGVDLPERLRTPCLLKIKNIRNKLAHGEIIFSTACQDMIIKEFNEIISSVRKYLMDIITEYENFIDMLDEANSASSL